MVEQKKTAAEIFVALMGLYGGLCTSVGVVVGILFPSPKPQGQKGLGEPLLNPHQTSNVEMAAQSSSSGI